MNTIESLMREMEEDRRQRRIAALSDTTQVDEECGKWNQAPTHVPPALSFPARHMQKNRIPRIRIASAVSANKKRKNVIM